MQTLTQRMGSDEISVFAFVSPLVQLNFNGDVDTNADVKCEQSVTHAMRKYKSNSGVYVEYVANQ